MFFGEWSLSHGSTILWFLIVLSIQIRRWGNGDKMTTVGGYENKG
jgi:hypothetical protein